MPVKSRQVTDQLRHMKGRQVPVTLYLAPRQYWMLKAVSRKTGLPMQYLLRRALVDVIGGLFEMSTPGARPRVPQSSK